MIALYRKYRPQTFADVAGQDHITAALCNEIRYRRLGHAYLFYGPRGTGKTTLARLVARAVNCTSRPKDSCEPCNSCDSCIQILQERYLDVVEIDAATHTQVDNVRDVIISSVAVPPLRREAFKIFIIDEVHMLSRHAFNALLKTIEEPPAGVLFILATTAINKVPETVVSRCEQYVFRKISSETITHRLAAIIKSEKIDVPDGTIGSIARQADGSLRDAISLLDQVLALAEKGSVSEDKAALIIPERLWGEADRILVQCAQRNLAGAITLINEIINGGTDPELLMADAIELLRRALLHKATDGSINADVDEKAADSARGLAETMSLVEIQQLLSIFIAQSRSAYYAHIPQLPLELAVSIFCTESSAGQDDEVQTPAKTSAPKKSTTTQPVARSDQALHSDDVNKLKAEWTSVLARLRDVNMSLATFLKVAHPLQADGGQITLGFKYGFHADTVREAKNKHAAESAISGILGRSVLIDCIVDPDYTDNHKMFNGENDTAVSEVIDIMGGGKVV